MFFNKKNHLPAWNSILYSILVFFLIEYSFIVNSVVILTEDLIENCAELNEKLIKLESNEVFIRNNNKLKQEDKTINLKNDNFYEPSNNSVKTQSQQAIPFPPTDSDSETFEHPMIPEKYKINYMFDEKVDNLSGKVKIEMTANSSSASGFFLQLQPNNKILSIEIDKIDEKIGKKVRHSRDDMVDQIRVTNICRFKESPKNLFLKLSRSTQINEQFVLTVEFMSTIGSGMNGVYQSYYTDRDGKKLKVVSTHFEPDFAPIAFPCFDHPSLRAIFELTLIHPTNYTSLSNTDVEYRDLFGESYVQVKFKPTTSMCTYLFAFAVFQGYKNIQTLSNGGKMVRVWLPSELIDEGNYALKVGSESLDLFEEMIKVPYMLDKIDLIGIPNFEAGAMENWGLVTFRMDLMTSNNRTSTEINNLHMALTVSHEVAHQWFGNLISINWWNDIWLNEGFASFMEHYAVSRLYPEYRLKETGYFSIVDVAMRRDEDITSHPIAIPSSQITNIRSLFDSISYSKGSAIINMLFETIGKTEFFNIFQSYFSEYKFQTKTSTELFEYISKFTNDERILQMFRDFTLYDGFPLISVNTSGRLVTLSQQLFKLNRPINFAKSDSSFIMSNKNAEKSSHDPNVDDSHHWTIPVHYLWSDGVKVHTGIKWLDKNEDSFEVDTDKLEWIKLNHDGFGYYRTNYELGMWKKLIYLTATDNKIFSLSDKLNMISDTFHLAKNGMISIDVPLGWVTIFAKLQDYFTTKTLVSYLTSIERHLRTRARLNEEYRLFLRRLSERLLRDNLENLFTKSVKSTELNNNSNYVANKFNRDSMKSQKSSSTQKLHLSSNVQETLQVPEMLVYLKSMHLQTSRETKKNEDMYEKLKIKLLQSACIEYKCSEVVEFLNGQFDLWTAGQLEDIEPNQLSLILQNAIMNGNSTKNWEIVFDHYLKETSPNMKARYLGLLPFSTESAIHERLLDVLMNTDKIPLQDITSIISGLVHEKTAFNRTWNFFKENYNQLNKKLIDSQGMVSELIVQFSVYFTTEDDLIKFKHFFADKRNPVTTENIDRGIEIIKSNINWEKYNLGSVSKAMPILRDFPTFLE